MDALRKTNDTSRERGHSREHLSLLGLAKSTKEKTPLSGIFLVLGLAIFLLSTASMILMLGAQAGGANLAWGLVFLPLWIGDGLTVVCLIGAMISACCAIVQQSHHSPNPSTTDAPPTSSVDDDPHEATTLHDMEDEQALVVQKNRELVAQGPSHVNHIKHVLISGFCCPFMFLPPLPLMGLLFGFHLNCWRYLSNTNGGGGTGLVKPMTCYGAFVPLYIVLAVVMFPYVLCRFYSWLGFVFLLGLSATSVLFPYKIEAKLNNAELSWLVVFLPLLCCIGLVFLQILYVFVNDVLWTYRQRVRVQSTLQRWSLSGYLVGFSVLIVGTVVVVRKVDQAA